MAGAVLEHRLARREDIPALITLMEAAIAELQKPFLDDAQIAASRAIMGLDTQLIDDGTYFVIEEDGALAGCGGWSRRATLYGSDRSPGRDVALLYQLSLISTDVGPIAQSEGHDAPGLVGELVPRRTAVIENVAVGGEDPVREPVLAQEL